MAAVLDPFTETCFAPECHLHPLQANGWERGLAEFAPDLLFVESAWFGAHGSWHRKIAEPGPELAALLAWFKRRDLPTVFWCKEDPVHFERFLQAARLFDVVFTTALERVPFYKQALGHLRVGCLPFACQPAIHHPIESAARRHAVCFAGAYYRRFPERTRDLETLVDGARSLLPLDIYDRYLHSEDANYRFPPRFAPLIKGTLAPDQVDQAYKGYRYALNLNTVKDSRSMFARRVFELLGSGTITLSNESPGLPLLFGDIVIATDDGARLVRALQRLLDDDPLRRKTAARGVRKVMLEHTYRQRLAVIAAASLGRAQAVAPATVLVVGVVRAPGHVAALWTCLRHQSYTHWQAILLVDDAAQAVPPDAAGDARLRLLPLEAFGARPCADLAGPAAWVAPMHPADYYGPDYLLDAMLARQYSAASAFGRGAWFDLVGGAPRLRDADAANRPLRDVQLARAVLRLDRVAALPLRDLAATSLQLDDAVALSPFNYCRGALAGGPMPAAVSAVVDDATVAGGASLAALATDQDARTVHVPAWLGHPCWRLDLLAACFPHAMGAAMRASLDRFGWLIESDLPDGASRDTYGTRTLDPCELGGPQGLRFHVVAGPGLAVALLVRFEDAAGTVLRDDCFALNTDAAWMPPAGCARLRLGLRITSSGATRIRRFALHWMQALRQHPLAPGMPGDFA